MQASGWDQSSLLSHFIDMHVNRELTPMTSLEGTVSRKNPVLLLPMEYQRNTSLRPVEEGVCNDEGLSGESFSMVVRLSLRGKKWMYRGEGNANVVIALPQEHKVIRLRKRNASGAYSPGESASFSLESKFCSKIMIPLLGAYFVSPPTVISIDRQEILELETQLADQRPASRLHKSIQLVDAALYMDFTRLPMNLKNDSPGSQRFSTFCVEIKPKQGWVPEADRKLHKCRFCLQQFLKVMTGKVESLSQYCPLDLFSGHSWRMKKSLCALLDSPQNNLKIFQDGMLVYGQGAVGSVMPILKEWLGGSTNVHDHKKLLDKFCFVLMEALTRDMSQSKKSYEIINKSAPSSYRSFFGNENSCDINGVQDSILHGYCEPSLNVEEDSNDDFVDDGSERIPNDLLRTAKEVAIHALETGKEISCNWDTDNQDKLHGNCVLKRILNVQQLDSKGADLTYAAYQQEVNTVGVPSNFSYIPSLMDRNCALSPIHRYLLSTTAKDCSVMVAFQEVSDCRGKPQQNQHIIQCPDGQNLLFNVGVIDLEPKPISCIEKHVRRDCDVYNAYINWHL